jgi:hypothetical protein
VLTTSDPNSNLYTNELAKVATSDVSALCKAQVNYGNSWKKRGGVGAFMMLARKWDRLEQFLSKAQKQFDIFDAIEKDQRAEGIIDDIRDLRRYLCLVEAEAIACGFCPGTLAKDLENGDASKGGSNLDKLEAELEAKRFYQETDPAGPIPLMPPLEADRFLQREDPDYGRDPAGPIPMVKP